MSMFRQYYRETREYLAGQSAWLHFKSKESNPYDPVKQTKLWLRWDNGFNEAESFANDGYQVTDED